MTAIIKNFDKIWTRIKEETPIRNLTELAEIAGISQSGLSKAKGRDYFSAEWAYLVGKKYGLLAEWIMSGEGPKRISEKKKADFLSELEVWAKEVSESENLKWLENQIENQFPDFKRWREEKTQEAETTADYPSSKVA